MSLGLIQIAMMMTPNEAVYEIGFNPKAVQATYGCNAGPPYVCVLDLYLQCHQEMCILFLC